MSDFPKISISVVLKQMQMELSTAFFEYGDGLKAEMLNELKAALHDENIKRLVHDEVQKFIAQVVAEVFNNYSLKRTIADKIARNLEEEMKA